MPQTALFKILEAGKLEERQSLGDLFTSFYEELHRRAKWELRQNSPPSLGPTTLLHETFLDMSNRDYVPFADCRQFVSYAARAMRGLIINHFRKRHALKRGGRLEFTPLTTDVPQAAEDRDSIALEGIDEALESLATIDPRLAECVDMKFFCGLSFGEIARIREVSERTVQRDWDKARLLLNHLIKDHDGLPKPE